MATRRDVLIGSLAGVTATLVGGLALAGQFGSETLRGIVGSGLP